MSNNLKSTPLYEFHKSAGANMADFGGFEMPLWYETGVKNEHLAVLKSAGLFDTSHMACINIKGEDSFELINYCFSRDIKELKKGRCIYGAFLDIKGHCIDDAIVYKFSDTFFMICVNAGMGKIIADYLNSNISKNLDISIEDLSGKIAKMDIQGKNCAKILSMVIKNPDTIFDKMPYFSFKGNFDESMFGESNVRLLDNTPILLSRSGYTGEFGFEIFISPDAITSLWDDVLKAGNKFGITPCGLASRDSLRTGACLPLSHQDIGSWKFINHPWDFALSFNKEKTFFTKKFIGDDALLSNSNSNNVFFIYPFVGDSLRKITPGEKSQVIDEQGQNIGKVLTCVTDMGIEKYNEKIISINSPNIPDDIKIKGLSCGFIKVYNKMNESPDNDLIVTLKEGKRSIKVKIVKDIRPDRTARKALKNFI